MPRLKARGEVFEILYEYKRGDLDIGDAYDLIFDEIRQSYTKRGDGGPSARYERYGKARRSTKKRKLSAWNKFVKANSKKPRFVLRSGKLNLKKMAVAFRKTPAGKKKKRR